jgi:hypothetical protein
VSARGVTYRRVSRRRVSVVVCVVVVRWRLRCPVATAWLCCRGYGFAICDAGRVRSGGRVPTSPQGLAILANSLGPDDHVALEATGNAQAIARALEPHVAPIVVATRAELRAITDANVKTDSPRRAHARAAARRRAAARLRTAR